MFNDILIFMGVCEQDPKENQKNSVHTAFFQSIEDHNGIVFFLGTSGHLSTWQNPSDLGRVLVTSSPLQV